MLQGDVVPATCFHVASLCGNLHLGTVNNLLYAMLGVAPSTEIEPAIVVFVNVVEHQHETFGTRVFACTQLYGGVVAQGDVANVEARLVACCLTVGVAVMLPLSFLWCEGDVDRFAVDFLQFERCLCSPCSESDAAFLWCNGCFFDCCGIWVVLVHLENACANVVGHEFLNVV